MILNGWAALVLIIFIVVVWFLITVITSMRHEEKMMILKIEEIKARIENDRIKNTKTDKKKIGRGKRETK